MQKGKYWGYVLGPSSIEKTLVVWIIKSSKKSQLRKCRKSCLQRFLRRIRIPDW